MLNQHFKIIFSGLAIASNLLWQGPIFGQDLNPPGSSLGQSDWQTPATSPYPTNTSQSQVQQEWQNAANSNQNNWQTPGLDQNGSGQGSGQSSWQNPTSGGGLPPSNNPSYGQSDWQIPVNNGQAQSFAPNTNSQTSNQSGQSPPMGQSGWQTPGLSQSSNVGQSAWQQPQSAFQTNSNQPNNQQGSDYYYGQANQNIQAIPVQSQPPPNYANQNNNQNNWQTAPPQQGQVQKSSGGLKQVIGGVTQTALAGARIMAPIAGMYMYGKAMARSPYAMGGMPYGGIPYGGIPYGGYPPPMPYGYGGMGGLSSFMHY